MASRLQNLKHTPLPPLPAPEPEEEGYRAVGPMAQRAAQKGGVHVPVHVEIALHGTLVDHINRRAARAVDAFFSADLACVRAAVTAVSTQPEAEYLLATLPDGIPVIIDRYPEVVEVRTPTTAELT